jgi:hypothetical protein
LEKISKTWERPQLIFLARGLPEENVLTGCKTQNPAINVVGPSGPDAKDKCAKGSVESCSNCAPRAYGLT